MTQGADTEVAIVGASLASYFAAATLARAGVRVALLQSQLPQADLGVIWPGLTDHWGILADNLGEVQAEALIQVVARSRDLLWESPAWAAAQGRRGGVMQLASNATEMLELTRRLRWLSHLWPRRLMSAGSASNYMTVNQVEGASFVGDCGACQASLFYPALVAHLADVGVDFPSQSSAEIVVQTDPQWPWLFEQAGAVFTCESVPEPWNESLVGIESHRGHLMMARHPQRGWQISGFSPEGDSLAADGQADPGLIERLAHLAGQQITCLEGGITSQSRALRYLCSADGLPVVGPLPGGKTWLMTAFASREWSLGPALGEQVALALLGQPAPLLTALPCLRPSRFL
jgi:glycine/D-amino acid oxidase-like deaminating enzyme